MRWCAGAAELAVRRHDGWLWPVAERQGLPRRALARRFLPSSSRSRSASGLRLILDHCGRIRQERGPAAFADLDALLKVAKRPMSR